MGQAKSKRERQAQLIQHTKPLSRPQFELYTIGTRRSLARYMADELSYWANHDETLIGFTFRDTTDNDFGWIVLARDRIGRFRAIHPVTSLRSNDYAITGLRLAIGEATTNGDVADLGSQGDEPNSPTDLLHVEEGFDREKLHPYFRVLLESPSRQPARAVVREIGPWLALTDPHFVKEFQEAQFDQRIWELYLWAALRELAFDIEHYEAPDFRCRTPWADFTLEATTAAPSTMGPLAVHPNPATQAEMEDFLNNYMPLKYGSALMTKLNKKNKDSLHYWQREHATGKPIILAIADFHRPATNNEAGSLVHTQSALWQYLYGTRVSWDYANGELVLKSTKVATHKYAQKEAPSGFFDQELAKNVSAVLFSNAGTLAKFDRMGVAAGYAAPDHKYYRVGLRLNPDPNATMGIPFHEEVQSEGYEENWYEELQLFHNPNAFFPIPRDCFRGVTQHFFENENLHSIGPADQVLSSYTLLMHLNDDQRIFTEGS